MTDKSDPQIICEAMGRWNERNICPCPTFTAPDELWGLLQWLMEREDWEGFVGHLLDQDAGEQDVYSMQTAFALFIKWLLHHTRLVELAAEWIKTQEKGE